MTTYKLKLFEYQKIRNTWEIEFDTADQATWERLLEAAAKFDDVSPDQNFLYDIPKIAPADPEKWFELGQLIFEGRPPFVCLKKGELMSLHDGELDISTGHQLEDAKGNILLQETNDDMF